MAPRSAAKLPLPTGSADVSAKVPPLRPAYAVIEAGIQELHTALQVSYGPSLKPSPSGST